jgi:hypothetical protein
MYTLVTKNSVDWLKCFPHLANIENAVLVDGTFATLHWWTAIPPVHIYCRFGTSCILQKEKKSNPVDSFLGNSIAL